MSLAALERAQLLSRASSIEERRQYVDHLLTLPAYKDPELTAYFGSSIPTHFAELEELQDQSVDAVLDLCEDEDERTRICGIKALAAIGKVEPRWVRGNTGVLLQLLESPPSEVRHVRQALYDLMDVSAADVFSMMAEDCKGSEDETGASRRKILDFLQASSAKRAEVLESGKDVEAEKAFAEGFYEVIQTTAFAEKRQILTLLLSLSTISGRNATPATTGRYAKAVTRCLKPNSPVALTTPIIRLWAELLKRKPELDPRWTIYFLADHGAAVVSLLTDKQDKQAQEILLAHTLDPRRLIRSVEDRTDRDLGAKDLVPDFAETMLKAAQRISSNPEKADALEMALYSLYTVIIINRSTRDSIRGSLARSAKDVSDFADKQKRASRQEGQIEQWRNIRDMADTIADRGLKPTTITPTWTKAVAARSSTERLPAAPESTQSVPAASSSARTGGPAPPTPTTAVQPAGSAQGASGKDDLSSRVAPTSRAPEPARAQPDAVPPSSGLSIRSRATPLSTVDKPSTSNGLSIRSAASTAIAPPLQPATAAAASTSGGLSIRSAANTPTSALPPTPQTTGPAPPTPTTGGLSIRSAAAKVSASPVPTPGLSIRSAATSARSTTTESQSQAGPSSLLSRFGAKRPREETTSASTSARSLVDRLGDNHDAESSKRPRPNLLSRMSSGTKSAPAPDTPTLQVASATPGGFSIKSRAHAPPITATPGEEDGIVRKGRGFMQSEGEDIFMAPPPPQTDLRLRLGSGAAGARRQKGRELLL